MSCLQGRLGGLTSELQNTASGANKVLGGLLGGRGSGSTSGQTEAVTAAAAEAEQEQTGKHQPGLHTCCIACLSGSPPVLHCAWASVVLKGMFVPSC